MFYRLILEREGPRSLFRGLGPNLVGVAPSRYSQSHHDYTNQLYIPNIIYPKQVIYSKCAEILPFNLWNKDLLLHVSSNGLLFLCFLHLCCATEPSILQPTRRPRRSWMACWSPTPPRCTWCRLGWQVIMAPPLLPFGLSVTVCCRDLPVYRRSAWFL